MNKLNIQTDKPKKNILKVWPWKYRNTIGMKKKKLFKSKITNYVYNTDFLSVCSFNSYLKKEMLSHTFKFH